MAKIVFFLQYISLITRIQFSICINIFLYRKKCWKFFYMKSSIIWTYFYIIKKKKLKITYTIFDYLGNLNKRIKIVFSLKYSFDCLIFKITKYSKFNFSSSFISLSRRNFSSTKRLLYVIIYTYINFRWN